ncbi:MAG: rod shape-determining protein RodA [Patescibacteria group bacterium]
MPKGLKSITSAFAGMDWWLLAAVFLLTLFGLAALYSIGLGRPDSLFLEFKKQIIFLIVGLGLMFLAASFNYNFYRLNSRLFYVIPLLLIIGVLFFGVTVRGTRGWFSLLGFSFQPVELMKLGVILGLAVLAAREARSFKTLGFFVSSLFLVVLPSVFVIFQPDLGSALLLCSIWLAVLLVAGTQKKYLLALVLFLAGAILFSWLFLFKDYQKERFLTFVDPARDPLDRGYNVTQAVIAVGSGQVFGRGLGYGSQSQLRFLPETQTDFIFAVIAEELGLVGSSFVLLVFLFLFYRLIKIALTARDDFALFTAMGILGLFFSQFIINVGMNIGLLPVTGITLPFMSAGGSSLTVNFVLIGIAQSIAKNRQKG